MYINRKMYFLFLFKKIQVFIRLNIQQSKLTQKKSCAKKQNKPSTKNDFVLRKTEGKQKPMKRILYFLQMSWNIVYAIS